ncbi:MAG: hypothetical protein ABIP74_01405 [Candidatus Saccharimonas sp.]
MNLFRATYYIFSRYTGPDERRVGKFFARVKEQHSSHQIEKSLLPLLQRSIAIVNLWTEHRYKGYTYLAKRTREELYENLGAIHADFAAFSATEHVDIKEAIAHIASLGVDTAKLRTLPDELVYLTKIMRYLAPRSGRYVYRLSSSFGRLLRDPKQEVLEGDCNQIVTLYLSLYAAKFPITDLRLTLLPNHVALHFCGVDIEATTGEFAHYDEKGQHAAPVYEIVSVNLLDTSDTHVGQSIVNPEVFLQAARLAYIVSSDRKLVEGNLAIAYRNTVSYLLEKQQFTQALIYALQSKEYELIEIVSYNGSVHTMGEGHFKEARGYARRSSRKQELARMIDEHEAVQLFRTKHYQAALKLYKQLGSTDGMRQCYRALYIQAQASLTHLRTVDEIKGNAGTIRTMERYAKASGDRELIAHAQSLAKHL